MYLTPILQSGTKIDEQTKLKFTSFFKTVIIELDKEAYGPDNHVAEWHRGSQEDEFDGFTVSSTVLYAYWQLLSK